MGFATDTRPDSRSRPRSLGSEWDMTCLQDQKIAQPAVCRSWCLECSNKTATRLASSVDSRSHHVGMGNMQLKEQDARGKQALLPVDGCSHSS